MNAPGTANPYLPSPADGGGADPAPRFSKLAIAAFILSLVPCLLFLVAAVLGMAMSVTLVGLLVVFLLMAPIAFLVLVIQSVAWGLAAAAKQRVKSNPRLRGLGLSYAAQGIAGIQALAACLQVGLFFGVPTLIVTTEAMAWRMLVTRGVVVAESGVAEVTALREGVLVELADMADSLEKLSQSGEALTAEVRALNSNTEAMSGSMESLARESAAWRAEVAALREMDAWTWGKNALAKSWDSLRHDLEWQ